jgi:Xaa-Pro aminopeptidase
LLHEAGATDGVIGYDDGRTFEGSSYAAMYRFAAIFPPILQSAAPPASLQSAWGPIAQLRSRLTSHEVDRVRLGCAVAGRAYEAASRELRPGLYEPEAAVAFEAPLATDGLAQPGVARARGFVWCMSGPNSALAGAAYAQSRHRAIEAGDLVLIHCNSYVDGYWTDVTRTYCMGEPDERQRRMYEAILAARTAALEAIRPGARAADVDAAAREVLVDGGFGEYFTHGLGHNLGFSVISNEFPPRLHPASPDVLEVGMTFNVEPSIYIEGFGGIRHCDVVTVGEEGAKVLTPFAATIEDLIVP